MPIPTPFHPRTSELCTSLAWKQWAGYHAVCSYDTTHDREYYAIRHAAALIDVTPLYKYEVRGPDAARFLSFVTVRNVEKLRPGRVAYTCWCDDEGKVVDDGTVSHLGPDHFRVTAAEPSLSWFARFSGRFDVTIEDSSSTMGALSLQGPTSRAILARAGAAGIERLRYFRVVRTSLGPNEVWISRTGYTGDLGFEVWVDREEALSVWDTLLAAGADFRIQPTGLDAMDVSRVEAGYLMNGVDYFSAHHCLIDSRKSSPFELGLGWTAQIDRDPFVGQAALIDERRRGSAWSFVGLELDWDEYEALFGEVGLPPAVPARAWRDPVPVYDREGRQVGQATSGAWSPILKKNLALASVRSFHGTPGTPLRMEVTVEYARRQVAATVRPTPFYDPERKRS